MYKCNSDNGSDEKEMFNFSDKASLEMRCFKYLCRLNGVFDFDDATQYPLEYWADISPMKRTPDAQQLDMTEFISKLCDLIQTFEFNK